MTRDVFIGWVLAFIGSLFIVPLSKVFIAYSGQIIDVNSFVYVCVAFNMSSLILLIYSGKGALSKETMRSLQTWGYGLVTICLYVVAFMLFSTAGATEGGFLQRGSVIFTMFAAWLFFGRKQSKTKILGLLIIAITLIGMILETPEDKIMKIVGLVCLWGFFHTVRLFIAETHQTHTKAIELKDVKSRARVIGFVMFIVSMAFTFMLLILAFLNTYYADGNLISLPVLSDFMNRETILLGMFLGGFFVTVNSLIEFTSSSSIKSENVLAMACVTPLATYFLEWITLPITGLNLTEFSDKDLILGILMTIGGLIMIYSSIKKKSNTSLDEYIQYSGQDIQAVEDSREIIANTLEHFDSNIKKSAKGLGITVNVLKAILEDKESVLAFKTDVLKKVARSYRKNVSGSDALTGLLNRNGFMTALKKATTESEQLSLFFIDLNKFKPVNDTYGHEAGDFVLKQVADRLSALFANDSTITRLGGDEYCILLKNTSKKEAETKIESISQTLEEDIKYNDVVINISGSIGLASYPDDTTDTHELVKLADKQMYVKKEGR